MGRRLPKGPNGREIRKAAATKAAALITRQTRKVPNVGDIRGLFGPGARMQHGKAGCDHTRCAEKMSGRRRRASPVRRRMVGLGPSSVSGVASARDLESGIGDPRSVVGGGFRLRSAPTISGLILVWWFGRGKRVEDCSCSSICSRKENTVILDADPEPAPGGLHDAHEHFRPTAHSGTRRVLRGICASCLTGLARAYDALQNSPPGS